ncbi:aminotransferase class I/II-fold pyridoxal phosphate-dependent enzyme [Streptomyces diastatochromogenes]|nr:aminotransferase class I/II-fold pyridoxal phosphate-dependent enzyme [Streptomyces diastatochromogenes]
MFTVEDTACAELALGSGEGDDAVAPVPLVAGLPMASTVTVGTLSKLFWGGLRVGWVRSSPQVVARLAKIKTSVDLACSVVDQLVAVRLLDRLPEARARRRAALRGQRDAAEALVRAAARTGSGAGRRAAPRCGCGSPGPTRRRWPSWRGATGCRSSRGGVLAGGGLPGPAQAAVRARDRGPGRRAPVLLECAERAAG